MTTPNPTNIQLPLSGIVPAGWIVAEQRYDGAKWVHVRGRMSVIGSIAIEEDLRTWVHLSIAHRKRMPTYNDLAFLKKYWLGDDRKAIMVMPAKAEHVNIHKYCLHLWCCLDDDPLPDFTKGMGSI